MMYRFLLLLSTLLLSSVLFAGVEVRSFETPEQEALYNELSEELRCLVCQNQNLAASSAELALDLKEQVYRMVTKEGMSREQIITYMVDRYGDFVLYKPPVKKSTFLLWFGPFILLLIGFFVLMRTVKGAKQQPEKALDDKQRQAMQDLLNSKEN
ncbi:MAG: Cytochrome c heme lyase subunit CcmL [uncultured Thiotrichaceae bacterium]|uniref:Cytochrome c-type biogenesis protein n=1 Tax=uncultured Thiotrichaceae bacterium TaxID=298394 RepID=A0A6S6SZ16_9GAMM|nr:MAG: Cytochrome c heme lyase subunit CcmL [uncultured Thiotrichaceae bacterium]